MNTKAWILQCASNALFYTLIFTILISVIDIVAKSTVRSWRACWGGPLFLFLIIHVVGNSFATLIAPQVVDISKLVDKASPSLPILSAFLYGFIGVFAFQGILANTNITFFKRGVLTIEEWISKARDSAIEAIIKKDIRLKDQEAIRNANIIAESVRNGHLTEEQLNAYLTQFSDSETVQRRVEKAQESQADPILSKAFVLVYSRSDQAGAIIKGMRQQST